MSPHWRHYRRYLQKHTALLVNALRRSFELKVVQDNKSLIAESTILLFGCLRNEAVRVPYFLDYHRALGVGHFLLVDNASTDGFLDVVSSQHDVSVWHTTGSYRAARFGADWLNYLRNRYGCGHWCLTLDPDEFLVYPFIGQRNIFHLTRFLELTGAESLYCRMVDMYADGAVSTARLETGQDPLGVCPWFDPTGYEVLSNWKGDAIRGGPRGRLFFATDPAQAPNLVKVPLIRWRRGYAYRSSAHRAVPYRLNQYNKALQPTGALLHFKFVSSFGPKVIEELDRQQHYGRQHESYAAHGDPANINFWHPGSVRYEGWQNLEAAGLLTRGAWTGAG
jgi:hypothetical protein